MAGIIKHLLDKTSPNIIFIWSDKVILGLGFASPNITLPDQINMILVSVLSSKCILTIKIDKTSTAQMYYIMEGMNYSACVNITSHFFLREIILKLIEINRTYLYF